MKVRMSENVNTHKKVVVIGGGAAGLLAGGLAARRGHTVTIIEKMERPARKLLITGKGRCNLTNACDGPDFIRAIPKNGRFLYSAYTAFNAAAVMEFFESLGVLLKVERGNRVFPASDRAADVVDALVAFAKKSGCVLVQGRAARLVTEDGAVCAVLTEVGERFEADAVVLATGGKSYPLTGSTGDGYALARGVGHTIVKPAPSLVPLVTEVGWCKKLQGLSLKNASLRVLEKGSGKEIYSDFGEMLFTHFGLSGPMALSASAHMRDMRAGKYEVSIDLKPALSAEQLDRRLTADFLKYQNRDFDHALGDLFPRKLIPVMVSLSGIPAEQKTHSVTKEQRADFCLLIKNFRVDITGFRPIEEAIVTSGGVCVKEIQPKTMASKLVGGLFFAGEIIDADAYTGGFNLQIAWSTGYLAGTFC